MHNDRATQARRIRARYAKAEHAHRMARVFADSPDRYAECMADADRWNAEARELERRYDGIGAPARSWTERFRRFLQRIFND